MLAGSGLATTLALTGVAVPAQAQGNTARPPADSTVSELVVTGSRVIANGDNSPTPVTVILTDQVLQAQPQTVAGALQNLPVFLGSQGTNSNPGGASANSGANVMNLRSIGQLRTLVLYDGHRVPPTAPTGQIDVNMIPQMLLQRVDVVTGGASAVYGSDAISGVVNFITDTRFNGLKLNAQAGVSTYGDDRTWNFGVAGGRGFAGGRGHVEASYEHFDDPGIAPRYGARSWADHVWSVQGGGTTANPFHLVDNTRQATLSFGGLITTGAPVVGGVARNNFSANGVLTPFVHGAATGTNGAESGGDGTFFYPSSLKTKQRSDQVFGRVDYEFTPSVKGYAEFAGTLNYNQNIWGPNSLANIPISTSNAFLSPAIQALLPQTANATFNFSKTFLQQDPVAPTSHETQYFGIAGLRGEFGDGYAWEVSGTRSEARINTKQLANMNNQRLYAALDAVLNPANGQVVCRTDLTNPGLYPGCVPLNVFGPTAESRAALDYVRQTSEFTSYTTMADFSGSLTGAPLSLPAGPVRMALSAEWRGLDLRLVSNALPADTMDCTGLRFCRAGTNLWASGSFANRAPVHQTVSEAAYEVDAPILKDRPFVKDLSVNAAVRYADYNTNGGVWTWKVGADWHIDDQLTLRATRSRDIRAPNLNDLYAPLLITRSPIVDLLTGQSLTNFPTSVGSNPNLVAEVADTTTAGFVYRPEWLPRFSLAVDAYDTSIGNAITTISGATSSVQQACINSAGASPYCALADRPLPVTNRTAANTPTAYYNIPINVAEVRTYGADIEANYGLNLFERPASLRLLVTYQPHFTVVTPGLSSLDMGGAAFGSGFSATPAVRATLFATFEPLEAVRVTILERWRSAMDWNGDPSLVYSEPKIPATAYTNINLAYTIKTASFGQTELFFNVQNLFNTPPKISGQSGATPSRDAAYPATDDAIGRYFTVGLHFRY